MELIAYLVAGAIMIYWVYLSVKLLIDLFTGRAEKMPTDPRKRQLVIYVTLVSSSFILVFFALFVFAMLDEGLHVFSESTADLIFSKLLNASSAIGAVVVGMIINTLIFNKSGWDKIRRIGNILRIVTPFAINFTGGTLIYGPSASTFVISTIISLLVIILDWQYSRWQGKLDVMKS